MKKIMFLFFVVLVGLQNVIAQKGEACATLNQNRTLQEAGEILMKDGAYYDSLRRAYSEAINHNIGREIITPDKAGMLMLLRGSKLMNQSFIVPSEFYNGVKYGNKVRFTTLLGSSSNYWLVFESEGVDYPYGKVSCMNPQKRKKYITPIKSPTPQKSSSEDIERAQRAEQAWANRQQSGGNTTYNYYTNNNCESGYTPQTQPRINVSFGGGYRVSNPGVTYQRYKNPPLQNYERPPSGRPSGAPSHSGGGPAGAPSHSRGNSSGGGPTGARSHR